MRTISLIVLALAWMPIACGGDSADPDPTGTDLQTETALDEAGDETPDTPPDNPPDTPEDTFVEEETCEGSVGGDIRIGEDSYPLAESSTMLSAQHNADCISAFSLQLDWQGCSLALEGESSESGWNLNLAELGNATHLDELCEIEGLVGATFNSEESRIGLVAGPEGSTEETTCIDVSSLAMVGTLVFGTDSSLVLDLDEIVLDGNFLSGHADEGGCAPAVETCENVSCGPDAYGVECGGCEDGFACIEGSCQVWNCPPEGPFGTQIGDLVFPYEYQDCDGNWHSLHDLCGAPASLFNLLAGY